MNKEFVRVRSILDYTISLALLIIGCAIVIIPTPASINIVGIFSIFAGILLDLFYSKHNGKAFLQVYEYIPYRYEPASEFFEHPVSKIGKLLK